MYNFLHSWFSCFSAVQKLSLLLVMIFLTSCNKNTENPLFKLRASGETGLDFVNFLEEDDSFNIIQYLYYYNGGGIAVGDVNNDELPDVFFTANRKPNRLYVNKGNLQFEEITHVAGVAGTGNWSTGTSMVDINADGWLDIYVCQVGNYKNFNGKNELFINQGDGTFEEQAAAYGLDHVGFSTQSAFFDYDLDGDLDMYLLCHSVHSTETYQDTSKTRKIDPYAGDKLFQNQNGKFVEVTETAGIFNGIAGYGLGISIGDIDQNGCPDIYIGNDFHENDFIYLNNCDGTFSEGSGDLLGHSSQFSMGNDLADFNNDGWLDIITTDMKPEEESVLKSSAGLDPYDIYQFKLSFGYRDQLPRNMLQLNQGLSQNRSEKLEGQPLFSEIAQFAGVAATDWSWSALMADFDNDGWKDLHITNGIVRRPNDLDYLKYIANKEVQNQTGDLEMAARMPEGKWSNYLFKNQGDLQFSDHTEEWGIQRPSVSNGAAYADLDNDGDLDLLVNNINETAFLYENLASRNRANNYLKVQLRGQGKNPFGIGTGIWVYTADQVQYQELNPVRGWQSSVGYSLIFGLGKAKLVDSVHVKWPGGGIERMNNIPVNQLLILEEKNARLPADLVFKNNTGEGKSPLFEEIPSPLVPVFEHQENRFSDLNRERLMPYLLSTQGPGLAVGDVNGDQLDDLFVGGASGQSGSLYIQSADGKLLRKKIPAFEEDSLREDVAALFIDADMDGDADLYVGSGGNEYYRKNDKLRDRLYFNNGKGEFNKNESALPLFYNQTSCVLPADYDQDGDLDLFVGSRSIPLNYGMPPDSYLLENNGNGTFRNISEEKVPQLNRLGMVTDAVWSDIDQDDDPDLLVVGEWMPLRIFVNENGTFKSEPYREKLITTSGWWNSIATADMDGDGDPDFLLGNWGENSNLKASPDEPVRLYLKDFDKNLSRDPVLTYYRQGKEYPVAGLDELAGQLVYLKKDYRQYAKFAQHTFREIFPLEKLKGAIRQEAFTFHSVSLKNNGKEGLEVNPLPIAAQLSAIQDIFVDDFDRDGYPDALLGGNFFEVQPAVGRLDASYGVFLKGRADGNFDPVKNSECQLWLDGQVRAIKKIKIGSRNCLVVAKNNAPIQFLVINNR